MKSYDMPEALMRALRGLYQEKGRLSAEAVGLKAKYDEVLRRFRAGELDGDKARALAYAIYDRLLLLRHELMPLLESRANELALEYLRLVAAGGGRFPSFAVKKPARARRPAAGEELRN